MNPLKNYIQHTEKVGKTEFILRPTNRKGWNNVIIKKDASKEVVLMYYRCPSQVLRTPELEKLNMIEKKAVQKLIEKLIPTK